MQRHAPALSLIVCAGGLWALWRWIGAEAPPVSEPLAVRTSGKPGAPQLRGPTAARPGAGAAPLAVAAGVPRRREIRVGLLAEPARSVTLEVSGPFRVEPQGGGKPLWSAARLAASEVVTSPRGLKIGRREFSHSRLEIVPEKSPAVWINGHQYRGRVRLYRRAGGKVLAVNVLPLEEYIASVIDSEMPAAFPDESRKAQAIVARTYALYQMQQAGADAPLDLYASTRSQKYLGFQYRDGGRLLAGESASSRALAAATRGQVCTYRGALFCTYYCAVCGGGTVRGTEVFSNAAAPLQPVPCDWCREARLYRWRAEIAKRAAQADLAPLLVRDGTRAGPLRTVSLVKSRDAGGLPEFDLKGEKSTVRVSGTELRQALAGRGLHSPRFTVQDQGRTFVISGRGHGHGVGLCQWGARGQALAGKTCEQILQHYYPGMKLARQ